MTSQKFNDGILSSKNEIYSAICDLMKIGCQPETIEKLDLLKQEINKGFYSPSTCSLNIFGVNLFIFDYEIYEKLYNFDIGE